LIGANLPDIDVLAYLDGPGADLAFRRGWTHGIPAIIVLPFLLTGAVVLFDRMVRRLGRATLPSTVIPRQVLLLAGVSVLTHPILDSLNTYGVRWLMPFSPRWFYAPSSSSILGSGSCSAWASWRVGRDGDTGGSGKNRLDRRTPHWD